jgi:hypothetical protein
VVPIGVVYGNGSNQPSAVEAGRACARGDHTWLTLVRHILMDYESLMPGCSAPHGGHTTRPFLAHQPQSWSA